MSNKEYKNTITVQDLQSSLWQPTMILRWFENHIPQLNQFQRTLQQKWVSETGEEEWRDIDVFRA